jgi:hypothetical protein
MRAQFEEKTYEQYRTTELVNGRQPFFSPGQILEAIVGFDVAIHTSNPFFWKHFPPMYPWWHRIFFMHPPGQQLRSEWWKELQREIEQFPKFKFNCFIQFKRPDRMVRSDAAEYSVWGKPYFRYDTFSSQQRALDALALKTTGKVVVVYACPAFHTFAELYAAYESRKLVQQSNFCEIKKLTDHSRYSFVSSGSSGIAHSEPVSVENIPFEQLLDTLGDQDPAQSNSAFLAETAESITSTIENIRELSDSYSMIARSLFREADSDLARSFASIYAFQVVCNVRLLIGHTG